MQEAALESYNSFRQTKDMSTADFYKLFKAKHKAMENVKCTVISDERKAHQFNAKLDVSRFGEIVNNIENGILKRPSTPQEAYELAASWKTIRVKTGGAYSAQEIKKKGKEPAADIKEKSIRESTRVGHHIPREDVTAFRERAIERGYKMGMCFICGKNHRAHLCPNYPEEPTVPKAEDAQVSDAARVAEELYEYDQEDEEQAYAAVRLIVSRANKKAFKDGKLTTGDLHSGVVGLDTCASNHLFGSLACINLVRGCTPLDFLGIGGRERITEIGDHDVWGTVYIRSGDS
jgi:hypothetical protein